MDSRRAALCAAALALALALPCTASAAGWLDPPTTVSSAQATGLAVAISPGQEVFAVWRQAGAVQAAVRRPGGSFGITQLSAAAGQSPPEVAVRPDGTAIAVWEEGNEVHAALRAPGGSFASMGALSSGAGALPWPRIAFTSDGTAIVAWVQADTVYAAARPPDGPFGAATAVSVAVAGRTLVKPVDIATDSVGDAIVAFASTQVSDQSTVRTTTARLQSAFRTPAGFQPTEGRATQDAQGSTDGTGSFVSYAAPEVAMDAAGNATVVAQEVHSTLAPPATVGNTTDTNIRVAVRPVGGFGTNFALDSAHSSDLPDNPGSAEVDKPALTFDSLGNTVVAWIRTDVVDDHPVNEVKSAAAPAAPNLAAFGSTSTVAYSELDFAYGGVRLAPLPQGATILVLGARNDLTYALRPAGGPFGPLSTASPSAHTATIGLEFSVASDPHGDVAVALARVPDRLLGSLVYDATPPSFTGVAVPASGQAGQSLSMSAAAFDAFSPVTFAWTFGDGGTETGAAVSHAYGSAGDVNPSVTAADAAGNSVSTTRPVTVAPAGDAQAAPVSPAAPAPPADPRVLSFTVAPKKFAVAPGPTPINARAPRGTRLRYSLSQAAVVTITFERILPGRRVGRRCLPPSRRLSRKRRCTRYQRVGRLTRRGLAAANVVRFTGRIGRKPLAPGSYRAGVIATTPGAAHPSRRRTVAFTIVRR